MSTSKVTLLAGLYGNALEWYDFILYANLVPILATLFFPTDDPNTSILLTFAVFATGFLVRPFGAVLFGYIGDHIGRRTALITSISVITLPTTLIGFIPTYQQIGIAAPILLTLLRILQGIAISGELNSAATYLIEHAKPNRRGLAGSLVMGTAFLGILLGAFASFILTTVYDKQTILNWSWRLPFWFSGVLGIIGLILRLKTHESPKFLQQAHADKHPPLKLVFTRYKKELFLSVFLIMSMGVGNYLFIAYVVTFLVKHQGLDMETANAINLTSMILSVGMYPVVGLLSDKIGRKPVFKAGLWCYVILGLPVFWLLSNSNIYCVFLGDLLLGMMLTPIAGMVPTIISEMFPTKVRNSGTTIGYNVALALFGGTTPLVAIKLVEVSGSTLAPAFYLIASAVISGVTLCFIEDRHRKALD